MMNHEFLQRSPSGLCYPNQASAPIRRRRLAGEQGRNPYDGLRPWSAVTHGAGVLLAIVGTVLLLQRAVALGSDSWHLAAFTLYGATMIGLYTASTLYHTLRTGPAGRMALRKYDHASIYCLIAGTYTPICLIPLRTCGAWGWALFGVIWTLAAAGMLLSICWIMAPRWLTAGLYLGMGWMALIAIYPLLQVLPPVGFFWLLAGGLLYTVGGVLYAVKWPGRNNPRFGCHEIFHVFIVLGSVCHFMMMYQAVVYL